MGDVKKLLVILGSTATGKTDLALQLASKFQGELVACDSRQVYIGLDIGTGKLPTKSTYEVKRTGPHRSAWKIDGIRIWMYDVVSPKRQYTVADYVKDANKIIEDIINRGKLPIIVGGTGLYLKALLDGLPNLAISVDKDLRRELSKLSLLQLQEKLKELFPSRWEKLNESDRKNPRRLIRAIELETSPRRSPYGHLRGVAHADVLKIGLTAPRGVLYKNVDLRVLSRMDQGMIDEVRNLHKYGLSLKRMRQLGLKYGVLADYLEGKIKSKAELTKIMQGKIHGYVRRQLTWFNKEKDVFWFDITSKKYEGKIEKLVRKWYDKHV